jgi:hypothetical protein
MEKCQYGARQLDSRRNKRMKRTRENHLIGMFILLAAVILLLSARIFAAPAASAGQFSIKSFSNSSVSLDITMPGSNDIRAQVEVCNLQGQTIGNDNASASYPVAYITGSFGTNKVYLCRMRYYDHVWDSNTYQYVDIYGDWSTYKAFCNLQPKASLVNKKSRNVIIKMPKVAGAKNMTLYMSTSQNSGYKKIATIKPGKSKILKGFKGKSFQYGKWYYYIIKINLNNGVPCEMYMNGFQITRRFF